MLRDFAVGDQETDALANQKFPAMSVVIVADRYETIRKTMHHLRAQGVRDRLEIIIVTLSAQTLGLDGKVAADFLPFESSKFRRSSRCRLPWRPVSAKRARR